MERASAGTQSMKVEQRTARKAAVARTQTPVGNRARFACRGQSNQMLQTKLRVGSQDDPLEREADRAAEQVMGGGMAGPLGSVPTGAQRKCAACAAEDKETVRRQTDGQEEEQELQLKGDGAGGCATGADRAAAALSQGGQPMSPQLRGYFEPRFAADLSGVRVHTHRAAASAARSINARAFTLGRDIGFGSGQFSPTTGAGRHLIAHELAHTVQQARGESGQVRRRVIDSHVTCHETGLRNPNLTGAEAVAAITAADTAAIALARGAENALSANRAAAIAGDPIDPTFAAILHEEFGLSATNAAHRRLMRLHERRYRRVRETLESGYLRYMCRGGSNVSLVGCQAGSCGDNFAFTCPGNRLMVLCQAFWDETDERAGTLLHEVFHIWFDMASHGANAPKQANSFCYEAFAHRIAGGARPAFSCQASTGGP